MEFNVPLEILRLSNGNPFAGPIQVRIGGLKYVDFVDLRKATKRQAFVAGVKSRLEADGADPAKISQLCQRLEVELDKLASQAFQQAVEHPVNSVGCYSAAQGQPIDLKWPELWPEPVALADALDETAATLKRFVVLPAHAEDAITLWLALTFVYDKCDIVPRLAVVSPTKRCGKSRLLTLIRRLSCRCVLSVDPRAAPLFRVIEKYGPVTIAIDEADTGARDDEELRGLLNAGHTRDTAQVLRCVGETNEVHTFSAFAPFAIGAIGNLPSTWVDRSVVITMKRKLETEKVEPLRERQKPEIERVQRRLFTAINDDELKRRLRQVEPDIPRQLNDRQADNWCPLLIIADYAGRDWPERARRAAVALSASAEELETEDVSLRFLRDVWTVIGDRDQIRSKDIAELLTAVDESPWATYSHGRPISADQVGRLLRRFELKPARLKSGRYYKVADIRLAVQRYLPSLLLNGDGTTPESGGHNGSGDTSDTRVTLGDTRGEKSVTNVNDYLKSTYTDGDTSDTSIPPSAEKISLDQDELSKYGDYDPESDTLSL